MTKIEWTEETWNPIIGCSKVSPGCDHCYAERMANRLVGMGQESYNNVMEARIGQAPRWNGKTHLVESALDKPLHWKKPRTIFVCSMGDLFHESVMWSWIDQVMEVIEKCPQHTFMVLTKRPEIMQAFFEQANYPDILSNLWLGVTAENQEMADKRIPVLLQVPAAKRFVSVEPMLGPVNLSYLETKGGDHIDALNGMEYFTVDHTTRQDHRIINKLDWVICGGESGPGARPMHADWARSLRDQCQEAEVPFFFKQWGEYLHESQICPSNNASKDMENHYYRFGKKKAGHLLDGKEWRAKP